MVECPINSKLLDRHVGLCRLLCTRISYTLFSVVLLVMAAPAQAADALVGSSMDSLYNIDPVVVRTKSTEEVSPVQTISGESLRRMSSHSVSDALRYFSGVQIKDYGGIGGLKTVNVRSLGSHHVGVFYDGVQVGNAQNGVVDLGKFSLDNMELISLYNGQKSNIFQSARDFSSASALYMVSRKPLFEEGKSNNWNAKIKGGSFDLINSSLLWEHRVSDKIRSSINVEFLNTSGKYNYEYSKKGAYRLKEKRRNGDLFYIRAEAGLFGDIKGGEWQAKAYFYDSNRGYPGAAIRQDEEIALRNEDRQKDRTFFVQSSIQQRVSKVYSYKLMGKYNHDFINYIMPPTTTVLPVDNRYTQQELYFSFANLFNVTKFWSLNVASDLQLNKLDADGMGDFDKEFVAPRRFTALTAAATTFDLNKVTLQGSLLHTFVHDWSGRDREVAGDRTIFTPTVVASYKPFNSVDFDVRAFYKKIFRLPTFNDLYYTKFTARTLKPEYTTQYNFGLVYQKNYSRGWFRSFDITADLYYNEVKDKIVAIPLGDQMVWSMVNLDYVEIRGLDLTAAASVKFGDFLLNGRAAYTYQKAQNFTPEDIPEGDNIHIDSYYGDQIAYAPWHSGSFILNAEYGKWSLNYSVLYTGKRYRQSANIPENRLGAWQTHDLSLSRGFTLGTTVLLLTAEINNIFNKQYEVVRWYPMPGTNFKLIISLTF